MGQAGAAVISPTDADALVGTSRLVAGMSYQAPNIADGPLLRERQHWVSRSGRAPTQSDFSDPAGADDRRRVTLNPVEIGLSTSTPGPNGNSMWDLYLELFPSADRPVSAQDPAPVVWSLEVLDDPVLEIKAAVDWVRLVETYGCEINDLIQPDWRNVCEDYAGVHLAARAVAAIQGFSFETRHGLSAPSFWDVEQTLWLRWVFRSVSPVGRIRPMSHRRTVNDRRPRT